MMNSWFEEILVCPRDRSALMLDNSRLMCAEGHAYPCVDGIPVMLLDDVPETHGAIARSLRQARGELEIEVPETGPNDIDGYVQQHIAGTNGSLYRPLINRLSRYPIPELDFLPPGTGEYLLDIGCGWGRWSISAAKEGYRPIGIDPSLEAILAARRISRQLNVSAAFLVADARYLPFVDSGFELIFSYSVLQHFARDYVRQSLKEVARVLKDSGISIIQMPNRLGLRNMYNQVIKKIKRDSGGIFDVRYWALHDLKQSFTEEIGPSTLSVDGFFSLNPQRSDLDLLPWKHRLVVHLSETLKKATGKWPGLIRLADSVYVKSTPGG